MTTMRKRAIEKSDELWPDYGDSASHALSGGFIDGAEWFDREPKESVEEEIARIYPPEDDTITELVIERWRKGFRLGAAWALEEKEKEENSLVTPQDTNAPLYLGFVFDNLGTSVEVILSAELETLKPTLAAVVDEKNLDNSLEFFWRGLGYYPGAGAGFGNYFWGSIQEITPGVRLPVVSHEG